ATAAVASGVGYVRTKDALDESEWHRKEAETAGQVATREQQRAVRSEGEARAARAQMLGAVRKTHEIVDAMPVGYIAPGRERAPDPVPALLGWSQVASSEADRFIELYGVFVRNPIADPEVRLEQARAWRRLGFLYFESDRPADTVRAMREAVAAADDLL